MLRMKRILLIVLVASIARADSLLVRTFAGTGAVGSSDGPRQTATFKGPNGLAFDSAGNLYVCDIENHAIRRIDASGNVTTIARDVGGPVGIAIDSHGNAFITDNPDSCIRKIAPDGMVSTFAGQLGVAGYADGTGTAARFKFPHEIAIDSSDNLYVADVANHVIRKITPAGVVSTLAGRAGVRGGADGQGSAATFEFPSSITVDAAGNVWTGGNGAIRKITPDGTVTTIAGVNNATGYVDGPASSARFEIGPEGLVFDANGNLLIADPGNQLIRSLSPDGIVSTVAGTKGVAGFTEGVGALLNFPLGMTSDRAGRIYFSDSANNVIRVAIFASGAPSLTITNPANGATITNGSPIRVTVANAVIDCASPWQLLVDGNVAATSCSNTVRLTSALSAGQHEFTAHLSDVLAVDAKVTVTIAPDPLFDLAAIVPGQARTSGSAGSFFRSSAWLTNPTDQSEVVRLRFVAGAGFAQPPSNDVTVTIPPHESVAYKDVVSELFAGDTTGGNVIVSAGHAMPLPVITARTFNDTPNGTFGQFIRAIPLSASNDVVQLHGLGADAANRSNLGIVNLSSANLHAMVTLFDAAGAKIGNDVPVDVAPYSSLQLGRVNVVAGLGDVPLFSARVTANGAFAAYVSKLDNVTSDPIFMTPLVARTEQWIDGIGAVHGADTIFKSTLVLANESAAAAHVRIAYTLRATNAVIDEKSLTIAPNSSLLYNDVINELFARPETAGTLAINSDVPVIAWARTYSDRGANGTLGQFIPAFERASLGDAILPGLSDNAGFRANLGIVNVLTADQDVRVEVFGSDAAKLGEQTYHVRGGEAILVARFLSQLAGRSVDDAYARVTGAVYAWASLVDNRSTDQTFVPAIP
jgi:sugar lactone lactonase YvrE